MRLPTEVRVSKPPRSGQSQVSIAGALEAATPGPATPRVRGETQQAERSAKTSPRTSKLWSGEGANVILAAGRLGRDSLSSNGCSQGVIGTGRVQLANSYIKGKKSEINIKKKN